VVVDVEVDAQVAAEAVVVEPTVTSESSVVVAVDQDTVEVVVDLEVRQLLLMVVDLVAHLQHPMVVELHLTVVVDMAAAAAAAAAPMETHQEVAAANPGGNRHLTTSPQVIIYRLD